jgi:acyl carrier protein
MNEKIRELVAAHARLGVGAAELADDSDLYDAGLSSHASVHLMLALENEFNIEIPDSLLTRDAFRSIGSIAKIVSQLKGPAEASAG